MKTYKTLLAEAQPWAKEVFEKIDKKLSQMTLRSYDKLPDGTTPDGFHKEKSINWWTNGFWGGTNHLMYMQTGNEDYLKTARRSEERWTRRSSISSTDSITTSALCGICFRALTRASIKIRSRETVTFSRRQPFPRASFSAVTLSVHGTAPGVTTTTGPSLTA